MPPNQRKKYDIIFHRFGIFLTNYGIYNLGLQGDGRFSICFLLFFFLIVRRRFSCCYCCTLTPNRQCVIHGLRASCWIYKERNGCFCSPVCMLACLLVCLRCSAACFVNHILITVLFNVYSRCLRSNSYQCVAINFPILCCPVALCFTFTPTTRAHTHARTHTSCIFNMLTLCHMYICISVKLTNWI